MAKTDTSRAICHQCKKGMDFYNYFRVPIPEMPGVCWGVCSNKCAILLTEETGVKIKTETETEK